MKISEILFEDTHEDAATDALVTLLATQHALGLGEISSEKLLKSLEDRNFFMDKDWLWDRAQNMDIVDQDASSADRIVLKLPNQSKSLGPESSLDSGSTDQFSDQTLAAEKRVKDMATRALSKRTK